MDLADLVHAVMRSRLVQPFAAVLCVALGAASGGALGCGLEDPSSIAVRRGILNLAYPEALHVHTAVWQAEQAGQLPRDPLAQRDDLPPEARATLRLMRVSALLRQLGAKLGDAPGSPSHPHLAVVLLGPVLWSRFEGIDGAVRGEFHVPGPNPADVVLVTDVPVVAAITGGELTFADALERRVARLYGAPDAVAEAKRWLAGNR